MFCFSSIVLRANDHKTRERLVFQNIGGENSMGFYRAFKLWGVVDCVRSINNNKGA